jgi:hypothetical protein
MNGTDEGAIIHGPPHQLFRAPSFYIYSIGQGKVAPSTTIENRVCKGNLEMAPRAGKNNVLVGTTYW